MTELMCEKLKLPNYISGYLNDPKTTAASITPDGWFHTGDIGHYDDEGHFFIVDRLKDLIKYKGFQVNIFKGFRIPYIDSFDFCRRHYLLTLINEYGFCLHCQHIQF